MRRTVATRMIAMMATPERNLALMIESRKIGWETSFDKVLETRSRLIESKPKKMPRRGPKKPMN